jgi:hypothetical protein
MSIAARRARALRISDQIAAALRNESTGIAALRPNNNKPIARKTCNPAVTNANVPGLEFQNAQIIKVIKLSPLSITNSTAAVRIERCVGPLLTVSRKLETTLVGKSDVGALELELLI